MNTAAFTEPHGGSLVNLLADHNHGEKLKGIAMNLPEIILNDSQLCDFELLATGAFSPLSGFMNRADYESVLDRMRLQDDLIWPLPVCLDISETLARSLEAGQSAAIRDPEGFLLAVMHIEDIWPIDRQKELKMVLGSDNKSHPGVQNLLKKTGEYYVGGKLEVISLPLHFDFKQIRLSPKEVRDAYTKLGWQRVVGFQTSNIKPDTPPAV